MDSVPLVSVIALCYNQEKYCRETLDSIYNQEYDNVELILIDNYSTDSSRAIIKEWIDLRQNLDITFIENDENVGIPNAVNIGLRRVRGDYIAMIACDDVMLPNKLKIQVNQLESENEGYGLVYSDAELMDHRGRTIGLTWLDYLNIGSQRSGDLFEKLLYRNHILPPTVLFRSKIFDEIGEYDEDLSFEDYDMILRISKKYLIGYTDAITAKYRRHVESASSGIHVQHAGSYIKTLAKRLDINDHYDQTIRKRIRRIIVFSLADDFENGQILLRTWGHLAQFSTSVFIVVNNRFAMTLLSIISYPYRKMTVAKRVKRRITSLFS